MKRYMVSTTTMTKNLIIIRGGGDIGTGTICRLHKCGFKLLVLEQEKPLAIRRQVSLCEAVYDNVKTVEGVTAEWIKKPEDRFAVWSRGNVPLIIDPVGRYIRELQPTILIDTILAKRNLGTRMEMAAFTIALGPGFHAGEDVHCVIETARGHDLGRVIYNGPPQPNSSIPGSIGGYRRERVVHAPTTGTHRTVKDIGTIVRKGEIIARIENITVAAPIDGIVRGMIRDQTLVHEGMKIGDIDPRAEQPENCTTISDKARCISGGVLEALLTYLNNN